MTPHDRWLEPDDEPEEDGEPCDFCQGWGWYDSYGVHVDCEHCKGTGEVILTDAERRQKAFDDFDPPDDYSGE
jgi:DnaJ-class molecular chaperone